MDKRKEDSLDSLAGVKSLVRAALFAALTATGAILAINVPFSPVPFTLQTMFTLMAGIILGARYGAASQVVYVAMGAIGLPVFSKGTAGVGVLLGPTGGYLAGFIVGAFVAGLIACMVRRRTKRWPFRLLGYTLASLTGLTAIYLLGAWRLGAVMDLSWRRAITVGVVPFLASDAAKALAAAWLGIELERRGVVRP